MAAELAERVGLRTPVHAYVDVTDKGENLVSKLGLQTVPTHVLVDSSGKLVSVLARKQFPNRQAVEALVATSCERDEVGFCIPCTPSKGDAGKAL
jgi:hypothetical protein